MSTRLSEPEEIARRIVARWRRGQMGALPPVDLRGEIAREIVKVVHKGRLATAATSAATAWAAYCRTWGIAERQRMEAAMNALCDVARVVRTECRWRLGRDKR